MMLKKLLRIPSFVIGISIIIFFCIPAIPGYLITTDKSTDANDIIPSIANKPPGFSVQIIRKLNDHSKTTPSLWQRWISGDPQPGTGIAIDRVIAEKGDSIFFIPFEEKDTAFVLRNDVQKTRTGYIGTRTFYLGTERNGRDVLSRLIIGSRVSLLVGFVSVLISLFIGTLIGLLAGYLGGRVDAFLSWLIAVFWSIPTLLIALGLSFVFGKGLLQVLVAIGLSTWVEVARIVRGQVMQLRNQEFVLATRIMGFSLPRILFVHILPNLKGSLTVLATTNFAAAILLEAGLSFLGLGIAPPAPSWGIMVKEHLGNLVLDSYYLALIPGFCIMLMVMAFNLVAMGIRDVLDTRLQAQTL